ARSRKANQPNVPRIVEERCDRQPKCNVNSAATQCGSGLLADLCYRIAPIGGGHGERGTPLKHVGSAGSKTRHCVLRLCLAEWDRCPSAGCAISKPTRPAEFIAGSSSHGHKPETERAAVLAVIQVTDRMI